MRENRNAAPKVFHTIIALGVVCSLMFIVLFLFSVRNFLRFDEDKLGLVYEKLTFEKYEQKSNRGGWYFHLYVKEYEEPFRIFTVTSRGVNRENLSGLTENDILNIAFSVELDAICEISSNGVVILSIHDYIKVNRNNQILGMLCSLIFLLCVWCLAWMLIRLLKPSTINAGLGRMRIEYVIDENIIRIYHTGRVCSLVINDQICDQHHCTYRYIFCLKGIIEAETAGGKEINVEAKMGKCYMRLYRDGQLVDKKFMAFG